jgi:hypothetical protein
VIFARRKVQKQRPGLHVGVAPCDHRKIRCIGFRRLPLLRRVMRNSTTCFTESPFRRDGVLRSCGRRLPKNLDYANQFPVCVFGLVIEYTNYNQIRAQRKQTRYTFVAVVCHIFMCVLSARIVSMIMRPIKSNQGACHWTISAAVCALDPIIIYI